MVSIILIWRYSNIKVCTAKVKFALLIIEDSGLQFLYILPPVNFSYILIYSYPEKEIAAVVTTPLYLPLPFGPVFAPEAQTRREFTVDGTRGD